MKKLSLNLTYTQPFIPPTAYQQLLPQLAAAHQQLLDRTGDGHEFLGWLDLPDHFDAQELAHIKQAAQQIQKQSAALVVIGIGGSYLGARAALEFLRSPNYNHLPKSTPDIYFIGNNLNSSAINETLAMIGDRDFSVNVISKSGTTLEPALAFRLFKQRLIAKYGRAHAAKRIYATTDKTQGALKTLSDQEGYQTFVVPDDVGGRYSVLTAVGLLPLAVADIDLDALLTGATTAKVDLTPANDTNLAWHYAGTRYLLEQQHLSLELLVNYEPRLALFGKWWQQLYGESEGKDHKGIFPALVDFTTDLHSLGQYIQEGKRQLFETVLWLEDSEQQLAIPNDPDNVDRLNYLQDLPLSLVNTQAYLGTLEAHTTGGVPNLVISIPEVSAAQLGYLFYFFEFACAISAYLNQVNPFNQPGVEAYKQNMFTLLKQLKA